MLSPEEAEMLTPEIERLMKMTAIEKKTYPLPEGVRTEVLDISYYTVQGQKASRPVILFIPLNAKLPAPLVFSVHYELDDTDPMLAKYLNEGWCVATPYRVLPAHNQELTDNGLLFHSAALCALRSYTDWIDPDRIALIGGSAGGYTSAMLTALHANICASVSFSGALNFYFTDNCFTPELEACNQKELVAAQAEGRTPHLPFLLHHLVFSTFQKDDDSSAAGSRLEDGKLPILLSGSFTNPILFTHSTADVLIPIDILTKRYTYAKPGKTIPNGFRMRICEYDLPEKYAASMEERLPAQEVAAQLVPVTGPGEIEVPFVPDKMFNFTIFDEGPVELATGHYRTPNFGPVNPIAFLKAQFEKTAAQNNRLTAQKLVTMAQRYAGVCTALPMQARSRCICGDLAFAQKSVLWELHRSVHRTEAAALFEEAKALQPELREVLDQMQAALA